MSVLGLETPSSVAWKIARADGMLLSQFLELALRLDWNRSRTDVDFLLANLSDVSGSYPELGAAASAVPNLPGHWFRSTWNADTRSHTARIHFCPDCLRTNGGHAKWAWRVKFISCCPLHERFLVSECPECREVFRFRLGAGLSTGSHWLDHWAYCPSCGSETRRGERAPHWLSSATDYLETGDDAVRALALKLTKQLSANSSLLRACSAALCLPSSCENAACVASAMIFGFQKGVFWEQSSTGHEVAHFALTGTPLSAALPSALGDMVKV